MSVDDNDQDGSEERTIFGGSPDLPRRQPTPPPDTPVENPSEERTEYIPPSQTSTPRSVSRFKVPTPGGERPVTERPPLQPPSDRRRVRSSNEVPRAIEGSSSGSPRAVAASPAPVATLVHTPGPNSLLTNAASILALGGSLRTSPPPADIEQLRLNLLVELQQYQNTLEQVTPYGEQQRIHDALFALCAYIDECVLNTVWGKAGRWETRSLLSEKFDTNQKNILYDRLDELMRSVPPDLELLEFYYVCLATGFLGYYGGPGGHHKHRDLRDRLYDIIRSYRQELDDGVGVAAEQIPPSPYRVRPTPPPTYLVTVTLLLLVLAFIGFNQYLEDDVEGVADRTSVISELPQLNLERVVPLPAQPPARTFDFVSIADRFRDDVVIHQGRTGVRIVVKERAQQAQFASGSAQLNDETRDLLRQLATALSEVEGRVYIEGHTDHTKFRFRAITNRQLSQDRAETVAALFQAEFNNNDANAARIVAVGRSDRDPLVCPSKPGWEVNRRVEIRLPEYTNEPFSPPQSPDC
ncbi:MAG: type IVB secretion system protein IcmH/DotU [Pseudomonadota bacterium]